MRTFGLVSDQEIKTLMVCWDCFSELIVDLFTPHWEKNMVK